MDSEKTLENHEAAVSLWMSLYNLCRVHKTLRCTPAMGRDEPYLAGELVKAALEPSDVSSQQPPTPETTLRPGYGPS
jgi:hypothetical protein